MILKSVLNATNKITAIGALAFPILRYSFGIINWRTEEIKKSYSKTRKTLTMYKMHHSKADIERLYITRKQGWRGMVQTEAAYKAEIINMAEYFNINYKENLFVHIIKSHESTQPNMSSIIMTAEKIKEELSQQNEKSDAKQDGMQQKRQDWWESLKKKWKKQSNALAVHYKYT